MDSSKISRIIVYGVVGVVAFVVITKVLPSVLMIAGNILSVIISLAVVAFVGLGFIKVLKWTVNK